MAKKPAPRKKTEKALGYLHGYTRTEQERLVKQAGFHEKRVYEHVDFSSCRKILEVGCGVGAQTEILLRRFPHLAVHGMDVSEAQIRTARARLKAEVRSGRAQFEVGDALKLPYPDNSFDGAFLCWFLEHVQEPVEILKEIRRVLKTNGVIFCSEVFNSSYYLHPYSPATLHYWFAFNDHQWNLGGDPFVGGKLANYLLAAGYQNISTEVKVEFFDNRAPKQRGEWIEYWTELLLSGAPELIRAGRVTPELVEEMRRELFRVKDDPDAVSFYSWIQARAQTY